MRATSAATTASSPGCFRTPRWQEPPSRRAQSSIPRLRSTPSPTNRRRNETAGQEDVGQRAEGAVAPRGAEALLRARRLRPPVQQYADARVPEAQPEREGAHARRRLARHRGVKPPPALRGGKGEGRFLPRRSGEARAHRALDGLAA